MSISNDLEVKLLNLVFNGTAYAGQSTVYLQWHTGSPSETGTTNVASETTRKAITFGTASAGSISNDSQPQWTNYPADETLTDGSLWDAASAGNCVWTGPMTPQAVHAGDTVQVPVGSLTVTLD